VTATVSDVEALIRAAAQPDDKRDAIREILRTIAEAGFDPTDEAYLRKLATKAVKIVPASEFDAGLRVAKANHARG
jgi:hypothetical protein